jgi:hypothetical protein
MIDITLRGNDDLVSDLRTAEERLFNGVRDLMSDLSSDTAKDARRRASRDSLTGRSADSIVSRGQQVSAGGGIAWYGFADFGGTAGRRRSIKRAFIKGGRYLFPAVRNVGVYKKAYETVDKATKGVQ